ncbi:hypothetical protein [Halonatronum saccharophilum]|uniref:hypothetical protein n=1 Tax=Halonatronum saccharophilum TaxID=150060 RepID=UPI0004887B10|nr:hypothetical protein [Halonatronum saccharophilum]
MQVGKTANSVDQLIKGSNEIKRSTDDIIYIAKEIGKSIDGLVDGSKRLTQLIKEVENLSFNTL